MWGVSAGHAEGACSDCCETVSSSPSCGSPGAASWEQRPRARVIAVAVPSARTMRRHFARPSSSRQGERGRGSVGCHSSPTAPVPSSEAGLCRRGLVGRLRVCPPPWGREGGLAVRDAVPRSAAESSLGAVSRIACSLSVRNLCQTSSAAGGLRPSPSGVWSPSGMRAVTPHLPFPTSGRRPRCAPDSWQELTPRGLLWSATALGAVLSADRLAGPPATDASMFTSVFRRRHSRASGGPPPGGPHLMIAQCKAGAPAGGPS